MSCKVPLMPLSTNDLRAMAAIVTAYLTYLRHGVPPSPKRDRSMRLLQGLERRLTLLVQVQETSCVRAEKYPLCNENMQVLPPLINWCMTRLHTCKSIVISGRSGKRGNYRSS